MPIYKPVSAELSMDSTVYESKKKFSYQASEADEFAMVFYHCIMELKVKRRC